MNIFSTRSLIKSIAGITTVGATAMLIACGSSSSDDDPADRAISNTTVKENYVRMAHAVYSDSLSTAESLQAAIAAFLAEPTESNLEAAKAAYKAARAPYQQSEIMRWDTDITLGTNTGDEGIASVDEWEGQVNAWPLDEALIDYTDASADNNVIAGVEEITADYLIGLNGSDDNEANVATGVHAIEFLLWGQDTNGTEAGAGSRPATDYDEANCTNGNCDRRRAYLEVVTQLLIVDLTAMVAEWSPAAAETDGTLAKNFLDSELAIDYIAGAMRAMATDELASARMSIALETGDPEEEHDCFSDLSHVAIYNNFLGVKNAFYGDYGSIEGPGVGDLLRDTDEATYDVFVAALDAIEANMQIVFDAGERDVDQVRYDQIIGQAATDPERLAAEAAINALILLENNFEDLEELLSLQELTAGGGGDGD